MTTTRHRVVVNEVPRQVSRNDHFLGGANTLGGVAPIPWRIVAVEELLAGQRVTNSLAAEAGGLAVDGARPLSRNRYKVPLVENLVRRTLLSLAGSA